MCFHATSYDKNKYYFYNQNACIGNVPITMPSAINNRKYISNSDTKKCTVIYSRKPRRWVDFKGNLAISSSFISLLFPFALAFYRAGRNMVPLVGITYPHTKGRKDISSCISSFFRMKGLYPETLRNYFGISGARDKVHFFLKLISVTWESLIYFAHVWVPESKMRRFSVSVWLSSQYYKCGLTSG